MCNTNDKRAKEFFMFSYFGILPKEIFNEKEKLKKEYKDYFDYVARKCAYRAYLDVCRTIKYSVKSTKIDKDKTKYAKYKDLKKAFIGYEINLIFDGLDDLLKNNADFDSWHKKTCENMTLKNTDEKKISKLLDKQDEEVKEAFGEHNLFNNSNEFTYGMAQKWLNMTIKNLLLAEDMFNGCTGYKELCGKRELFHVPVDKNVLNAYNDEVKKYNKEIKDKTLELKKHSINGWSNWDKDTYKEFVEDLKKLLGENKPALDWEHSAWMKYAE